MLQDRIKAFAYNLGFDTVGIAPAEPAIHLKQYQEWIAAGFHGQQSYLARLDRLERRRNLNVILPGVRTLIVTGRHYWPGPPTYHASDPSRGQVSCYAIGPDYHDEIKRDLDRLLANIRHETSQHIKGRSYVDTGPLIERDHALQAGLGFIGKNCHMIQPKRGSWLFLGILMLDIALEPDDPESMPGCGTCQRCQQACPTGAFVQPHILDSRRCISYLTTALKGSIPRELRPSIGNHIFGCDVCQQVCPWNRFAKPIAPNPLMDLSEQREPPLLTLIGLSDKDFLARFGHTPIGHVRRDRFLRNVAVALGNWGSEQALPALEKALHDPSSLIREHVAWALGQIDSFKTRPILQSALDREKELSVIAEIELILSQS
ncbi:MAG: tRNA epoxyqueuosine(34) reductase QueG [Anaerolineales bacterium]|nr:tRNA epoxyqueuosine(34) reductase QueG [Anaerolineales bacterium]